MHMISLNSNSLLYYYYFYFILFYLALEKKPTTSSSNPSMTMTSSSGSSTTPETPSLPDSKPSSEHAVPEQGTSVSDTSEEQQEERKGDSKPTSGGAYNPETGEINWDCPCLGGMAHGPCGPEFREAFSCFIFSEQEPKGVDCVEKFQAMQDCFRRHPEVYRDGKIDR